MELPRAHSAAAIIGAVIGGGFMAAMLAGICTSG